MEEVAEVKEAEEMEEVSRESGVYMTGQQATQPARKVGPFVPLQRRGPEGEDEYSETTIEAVCEYSATTGERGTSTQRHRGREE